MSPIVSFVALAIALAPTAEDKAEARRFKNEAFQKVSEGSYAEGVDLLRRAHDAVPHPTFLFNIAVVYDQWPGHCAESLQAFDAFFEACADCKLRSTAEVRFEKVQTRCMTDLSVTSEPAPARVTVDEEPGGTTPLRLRLRPGTHRLLLEAEGYEPEARALDLEPGEARELSVTLKALAPPVPAEATAASTGPRPGAGLRTGGWIAIGAGAIGTGVGVAFTVLANEEVDEERELRSTPGVDPADVREARDQAQSDATLAAVGYGVGIAGVATGIVLHVLAGQADRKAKLSLGTDGSRLILSGRF